MKVSVIGAGPAGLYFSTALKQQMPTADVTIYERSSAQVQQARGQGYVIEQQIANQLYTINPNLENDLQSLTSPWSSFSVESRGHVSGGAFPYSAGIRRAALLDYLKQGALDHNVSIQYDVNLKNDTIKALKKKSDLLVGADGLHSVVRHTYPAQFGVSVIEGKNSYAWLEKRNISSLMRVVIDECNGGVFITTSYPIDDVTHSIIVEASNQDIEKAGFRKETSSQELLQNLTPYFPRTTPPQSLLPQPVRWIQNRLNYCNQSGFENVALIGEAGVSSHYRLGSGLYLAFMAGGNLAEELAMGNSTQEAVAAYHQSIRPLLEDTHRLSLKAINWLENMSKLYQTLLPVELIESFRSKFQE